MKSRCVHRPTTRMSEESEALLHVLIGRLESEHGREVRRGEADHPLMHAGLLGVLANVSGSKVR